MPPWSSKVISLWRNKKNYPERCWRHNPSKCQEPLTQWHNTASQKTQTFTVCLHYKTDQLMLYRKIIAVCSESNTKHINSRCGQNLEWLNVKPGGTCYCGWSDLILTWAQEICFRYTTGKVCILADSLLLAVPVSCKGKQSVSYYAVLSCLGDCLMTLYHTNMSWRHQISWMDDFVQNSTNFGCVQKWNKILFMRKTVHSNSTVIALHWPTLLTTT
jgi:hypothetical protein